MKRRCRLNMPVTSVPGGFKSLDAVEVAGFPEIAGDRWGTPANQGT